jgi:autoinducer 2-degrading protein
MAIFTRNQYFLAKLVLILKNYIVLCEMGVFRGILLLTLVCGGSAFLKNLGSLSPFRSRGSSIISRPQGKPQLSGTVCCSKETGQTTPFALVVTVEIKPDRIEDFLKVIEADAIGSREKEEGGCLRFDVLRDRADPNKFVFYEVYQDDDAAARHKGMPHFKLWTDFKESGGVVSQAVVKADGIFYGSRLP